jgi:hypothetical protein
MPVVLVTDAILAILAGLVTLAVLVVLVMLVVLVVHVDSLFTPAARELRKNSGNIERHPINHPFRVGT